MRILVTGNQGYIGTVLATMLKAAGHKVVGLDSGLFRDCAISRLDPIPTLEIDVREVEIADLAGVDAVMHLAGLSNDPLGDIDPAVTYDINYHASVRLAELAKRVGVKRFIFASSCSVYGSTDGTVANERAPFRPVTPYARSKALAEEEIGRLAGADFCPVYLRSATAYGVSPMIRFDLVLNNLVAWATATGRVHIKSDGTPWRPIVHVADIARAYIAVLEAPSELVHNQAFNVGRMRDNYQIRDIAEIVEATVPGSRIEYASDAGPDRRCYRVDFTKLASSLPGFRPRWRAPEGAREIHETIRDLGLDAEDFEGARYNRLDHIKELLDRNLLDTDLRFARSSSTLPRRLTGT